MPLKYGAPPVNQGPRARVRTALAVMQVGENESKEQG
jgi:hypothetical protein